MTNNVVYIRRNSITETWDAAAIASLESRGWDVEVRTGLSGSWAGVARLVIGPVGPRGELFQVISGSDVIAGLAMPVVSLCRATSSAGLQLGGCSFLHTSGDIRSFSRNIADPRAIYGSVPLPHPYQSLQCVTGSCYGGISYSAGVSVIYSVARQAGGVVERIVNGHSRLHWGYHRLDAASPALMDLFAAFTGGTHEEFVPPPDPGPAPGDCHISGIVRDQFGAPASRTVRLYNRATGALLDTTTSNASGEYFFTTGSTAEVQVVALSPSSGLNDIITRATPGGC